MGALPKPPGRRLLSGAENTQFNRAGSGLAPAGRAELVQRGGDVTFDRADVIRIRSRASAPARLRP